MKPSAPKKKKLAVKRTAEHPDRAFLRLREAILTGELKEGEPVRQSGLAKEWKIGRTPLREAVRRAAQFGLLILRPNQRPVVRKLTAKDVRHIYTLRAHLEVVALTEAWERLEQADLRALHKLVKQIEKTRDLKKKVALQFELDDQLHHLWIVNCDNAWLVEILERLLIYRPNLPTFLANYAYITDKAYEEHVKILTEIEARHFGRASSALKEHLQNSSALVVSLVEDAA